MTIGLFQLDLLRLPFAHFPVPDTRGNDSANQCRSQYRPQRSFQSHVILHEHDRGDQADTGAGDGANDSSPDSLKQFLNDAASSRLAC